MTSLQFVLRRLALVCVGMSIATSAAVAADLATIPARKLAEVVEEVEDDNTADIEDRERLIYLLHHDLRSAVRLQVAESLAIKPMPLSRNISNVLASLASDESINVQTAALDALSCTLRAMGPLQRTAEVLQWVLSDDARHRFAIARALAAPMQILAINDALYTLENDSEPQVRRAARASRSALIGVSS